MMLNRRRDKIERDLRIYNAIELAWAILLILALSFASAVASAAVPDQSWGDLQATTITLARGPAEATTGTVLNRAWAATAANTDTTETITGYWSHTLGVFDNLRLDGNTFYSATGDIVTSPAGSYLIGPATGQNVLIDWDSSDAWVQFRNASTVQFELRNDGGVWEVNRGANSSNSIAISGGNVGIGGDALPDASLEVVENFYVSATANGDGDRFKVTSVGTTVKAGASAATVNSAADDLIVENGGTGGLSILTPAGSIGQVLFGRPSAATHGRLEYAHGTDKLGIYAGNVKALSVGATEIELTNGVSVVRGDYWQSTPVAYDDTYPKAVATVEDGYVVDDVYIEVLTPGNGTSYTFSVGDGDDDEGFMVAFDPSVVSAGNRRGGVAWGAYLAEGKLYGAADTVDAFYGSSNSDDTDWAAIVHVHVSRAK